MYNHEKVFLEKIYFPNVKMIFPKIKSYLHEQPTPPMDRIIPNNIHTKNQPIQVFNKTTKITIITLGNSYYLFIITGLCYIVFCLMCLCEAKKKFMREGG